MTAALQELGHKSLSELVDYIELNYHRSLDLLVPQMITLAQKVEMAHSQHPQCPKGLTQVLKVTWSHLKIHMITEEQLLFSVLRKDPHAVEKDLLRVMQQEHITHYEELERVAAFRRNFPLPREACRTWSALYQMIERYERQMKEHIALEEEILLPKIEPNIRKI